MRGKKQEKVTVDEAMIMIFININRGRKEGQTVPVTRRDAEEALARKD